MQTQHRFVVYQVLHTTLPRIRIRIPIFSDYISRLRFLVINAVPNISLVMLGAFFALEESVCSYFQQYYKFVGF